jgi:hypothetical protein
MFTRIPMRETLRSTSNGSTRTAKTAHGGWTGGSWWMKFTPAFYDGSSLDVAGVESYVSDARGYDVDGSVTGYDWAVCRLYEPLGNYLGYFGYNEYSDSWENQPYWSVIGYPGAVAGGQRTSFQGSVSSDDTDGDSNGGLEIESKADLTPGNSGGPMFGWWNGDPRLIGVVSGQEEEWSPGLLALGMGRYRTHQCHRRWFGFHPNDGLG